MGVGGADGERDSIRESTSVDAVGSGMRLFPEGAEAIRMGLLDTKTRNGVLSLGLRPL